jgi:thiol-disulfide isomerase/thioredoxin
MSKLKFFTANWCKWCQIAKPLIERIENIEVEYLDVDVKENKVLARKMGIKELPTLILFENGYEVRRTSQLETKLDLTSFILGLNPEDV